MRALLAGKANPNLRSSEGRMTPLHYAASCGRTEVVAALIAAGADVNAQNVIVALNEHWTCMHIRPMDTDVLTV